MKNNIMDNKLKQNQSSGPKFTKIKSGLLCIITICFFIFAMYSFGYRAYLHNPSSADAYSDKVESLQNQISWSSDGNKYIEYDKDSGLWAIKEKDGLTISVDGTPKFWVGDTSYFYTLENLTNDISTIATNISSAEISNGRVDLYASRKLSVKTLGSPSSVTWSKDGNHLLLDSKTESPINPGEWNLYSYSVGVWTHQVVVGDGAQLISSGTNHDTKLELINCVDSKYICYSKLTNLSSSTH